MKIIESTANLTPVQVYNMTKGNDVRKMSDAEGEILEISAYVLYEDEAKDGQVMTVLSLATVSGPCYATNSGTFIKNFQDIRSMHESMGAEPPASYRVSSGISKNGRKYLCCDIA